MAQVSSFATRSPQRLVSSVLTGSILLALVFAIYPDWYTTSQVHIDPWIYWGTAEAVGYAASAFGGTYYFRRWTLWIPQWFLTQFLGPLESQMVLRSLILLGISALIVSTINCGKLKRQVLMLTAPVVVLALVGSSFFIFAWSTSYHEGLGTLFFVAALRTGYLSRDVFSPRSAALFGGLLVLLFVTYQFTAFLFPALGWVYYSALPRTSSTKRFRALRPGWILTGASSGMLVDTLVGRVLVGGWENLLLYSVRVTLSVPNNWGAPREVWLEALTDWRGSIVGVWAVVTVLLLVPTMRDARLAGFLGLTILPYGIDFFRGGGSLFFPHTNVYLYVAVFFCLTLLALRAASTPAVLVAVGLGGILGGAPVFREYLGTIDPFTAVGIVLVVALASALTELRVAQFAVRVGLAFALGGYVFGLATTPWVGGISPSWDREAGDPRRHYESLATDHAYVTQWGEENSTRMFLIDARPHAGWSPNVNALYGMYSGLRLGYNGSWNCSWVAAATGPEAAIAIIGDYVGMTNENEPTALLLMEQSDFAETVEISVERGVLDQGLRACEGVSPWTTNIVLLDARSRTQSSAAIKIYGYR